MRSVRESYDLPKRPPLPDRQIALMLAAPLAALALWLALPDSPVTVALLAIALLFAVFMGVATSCARASSTRSRVASR